MIGWYLERADPVLARVWKVSTEKSTQELISWEVKKDTWIREFHEKVHNLRLSTWHTVAYDNFGQAWNAHGFDAIIGPGLASPAVIHK